MANYDNFKDKVHAVMKGEGRLGQAIDVFVIILIIVSLGAITLESVKDLRAQYGNFLEYVELIITIIFTIEYLIRLWSCDNRIRHVSRPLYLIDLVAILPFYISLIAPPASPDLLFARAIRVLRAFRILKLGRYLAVVEGIKYVIRTRKAELASIVVISLIFLFLIGSVEYLVEPQTFDNIPNAIWWALVTLATVGYGDIHPLTPIGKIVGSVAIYMSVAFIAIPTAIIGASLTQYYFRPETVTCKKCGNGRNPKDAKFCYRCGKDL
ncbi:Voltage-gated potassium channel [Candidatus Gugararchaeum adminiculabundum]|nr:Voltage-gated potassium channel [Candidatus Gugararchaeum adminiculabundum]